MTHIYELFGHDNARTYKPDATRWPEYFGIELEVENCNGMDAFGDWTTHNDGSLREGVEFVLAQPLGGKPLETAIKDFYNRGLVYTNGPRTSTHIHMNMSNNTVEQVRVMVLIMYAIEDAIFGHVGESRKWAGYAMPLSEMGQDRLRTLLSNDDVFLLTQNIAPGRNPERYYGFNVASLRKHGTVEFRYYPGGPTKAELESWLDLAWSLKKLATSISLSDMLDRITDAEVFYELLASHFDKDWMTALLRQDTIQAMFDKYQEVAALCINNDMLERREKLVFLTPPLLKFVNKNLLGEAGQEALAKVSSMFSVLSVGDFVFYFRQAVDADYAARGKSKPKNPTKLASIFAQEDAAQAGPWQVYGGPPVPPPGRRDADPQAAIMARYQAVVEREQARRQEMEAMRARDRLEPRDEVPAPPPAGFQVYNPEGAIRQWLDDPFEQMDMGVFDRNPPAAPRNR